MAYPSAADLVAESNVAALTGLTVDEQEAIYAASVAAVEEFTGQSFAADPGATRLINGQGGTRLYLPKRLETITALDVSGSALEVGDVEITEDGSALTVKPSALSGGNYYVQAMRALDDNLPVRFTTGEVNVRVTGDWGWSVFPQPVRIALRKDMEDTALADSMALNESIRAYRKLGLRDISQGNLRAAVGGAPGLGDEVMRLLTPFIWIGNLGAVI